MATSNSSASAWSDFNSIIARPKSAIEALGGNLPNIAVATGFFGLLEMAADGLKGERIKVYDDIVEGFKYSIMLYFGIRLLYP